MGDPAAQDSVQLISGHNWQTGYVAHGHCATITARSSEAADGIYVGLEVGKGFGKNYCPRAWTESARPECQACQVTRSSDEVDIAH